METVLVAADIDVDNVSILEGSSIRNAVADAFVDRSTAASWEVVVAERGRVGTLGDDILVNGLVDFFGCDSHCNLPVSDIKSLSADFASSPRKFNFLWTGDGNVLICDLLELRRWSSLTVLHVIWPLDFSRHFSPARERIRVWPQRPSEFEPALDFLVSLLVRKLVHIPEVLEALLGAEESRI